MPIINQLRSIIEWENPSSEEIFFRFTDRGDEIKNASKLILQPGQGCIFTYEGKIEGVFMEEGIYDLKTDNIPFITTLTNAMNAFESQHKVGLWFFRTAEILNMRWGTRSPIAYEDPQYKFPILLTGFGNYSIKITQPEQFFTNVIAGQEVFLAKDIKEIFLSRIVQPITTYLATSKFSFKEIDSNLETIAKAVQEKTHDIFSELGFELLDFRIEGTQFDKETIDRINEISDVQAEAQSAQIAGVSFAELQQLKAMRDMANNQGTAGAAMGMFAGMNMGGNMMNQNTNSQQPSSAGNDIKSKLKNIKELFEEDLISEEEFLKKKKELLSQI